MKKSSSNRIAVIGGGISGLVSAYRLLQKGNRVTLLEPGGDLGDLGATFDHKGHTLEQFHHAILKSDEHLLKLLDELGLGEETQWASTTRGFRFGKTLIPFNSLFDVFGLHELSLTCRIRTALGAAFVSKFMDSPKGLDGIAASEWLTRIFGADAYLRLWSPLLKARFGPRYEEIPAYWLWSAIRRQSDSTRHVSGYVPGGYGAVAECLRDKILALGGAIRLRTHIQAIQETPGAIQLYSDGRWEPFDAAVSTLPFPVLSQIVRGRLSESVPRHTLAYQGLVNAVVLLKNRLQSNYSNIIIQKGFPFQRLVEATHMVPLADNGGFHVVHLSNYCGTGTPSYGQMDADIEFQARKVLKAFDPNFIQESVEDIRVFRASFAEPVWQLGYLRDKPRMRCGDSRLYLATSAQCYPAANSWNTLTGMANDLAARLQFDFDSAATMRHARRHEFAIVD